MKVIIYTANINNYDSVKNIDKDPAAHYTLITDNVDISQGEWDLKIIADKVDQDPQRVARYIKTHPHELLPEHDISIWIDSSFEIKIKDVYKFIEENLGDCQIACYRHPLRDCIYEEGEICASNALDDKRVIQAQMTKYLNKGLPKNHGLFATGLIIRKNSPDMVVFNNMWWTEIREGSKRDQLSQSYCSYTLNIPINTIPGSIYHSEYLVKYKHSHKMKKNKWNKN